VTADLEQPIDLGNAEDEKVRVGRVGSDLAQIYDSQIEPVIRRQISAKLHISFRARSDSVLDQEAHDLLSETKVLILQKLSRLGSDERADVIGSLDAYVRTVTSNVFNQYLRRKYPRRLSLKNQLRYLLTHHQDLGLREALPGTWTWGWKRQLDGRIASPIALSDIDREKLSINVRAHRAAGKSRALIQFTEMLFALHQAPAFLDDLVAVACAVLEITEPTATSELEPLIESCPSPDKNALQHMEDRAFVRLVWTAVLELPQRHRAALLLNFNERNEDLLAMLPVMRIASIREIAETLGFSADEFAAVWHELPWDDQRIAEHLGLTRQQVINLRQSARQTLRRKLRAPKG
jgi:RNA polymerase sigma factor (sigma-70 family)